MTFPVVPSSPFVGIAAAANAGVTFDESSLTIANPDFPYEMYEELLAAAGRMKRSMSWWIGDLINFGEGLYPDRYSQAMEVTGLKYETLSNYAWVCRHVARSRRRDHLSFSVHDAVAKQEPSQQTYWLEQAEQHRWTTAELRAAMRTKTPAPEPEPEPASPLSPKAIAKAAGALASVHQTLAKVGQGQDVARDLPRAVRALEQAGETLRVAASAPTLHEVVERLLAESESAEIVGTSLVLTATLNELRTLVGKEAPE